MMLIKNKASHGLMVNQKFHICDSMNEKNEANKRTEKIQKTGTGNQDEMLRPVSMTKKTTQMGQDKVCTASLGPSL